MFQKAVLLSFVAASAVLGAPMRRAVTDTDVLQFALTLEHLESAFYADGLAKFDAQAFADAGFPDWVRGRFRQIGEHEAEHVKFLSGALGPSATQACEYNFPFNDPRSFAQLSMPLEDVGDSAYVGAAQLVSDKGVLTDAASILSVEARHAAWVSSAVLKHQGWNGPFDSPLTPDAAFSLASLFITSCPSSNPALPVQTFPPLTLSEVAPTPGANVAVKFTPAQGQEQAAAGPKFVAWLSGLGTVFSPVAADGSTVVPPGLEGTIFAAVVSSEETPSEKNMLSGFTFAQFPFDSHVDTP
ncbi:ferritin-like domain-containing protein [Trametes polyzona]|nr:ferritin-like domain-containing protein [Trametes polyzona]